MIQVSDELYSTDYLRVGLWSTIAFLALLVFHLPSPFNSDCRFKIWCSAIGACERKMGF